MNKRPVGRPKDSGEDLKARFTVRLTPQQMEALKRLGGAKWLRRQLDKTA